MASDTICDPVFELELSIKRHIRNSKDFNNLNDFCEAQGWNYKSFQNAKYNDFKTKLGKKILAELHKKQIIDKEIYNLIKNDR